MVDQVSANVMLLVKNAIVPLTLQEKHAKYLVYTALLLTRRQGAFAILVTRGWGAQMSATTMDCLLMGSASVLSLTDSREIFA